MSYNNEIWVFLSHSHEDYEKVRKVRDMLEDQQMRPLMFFLKCLNDHDEIDSLIKREIDCRTRFILCDSENARKSDWVKEEVNYIKSLDRIYETIDLDWSIEEIKQRLDEFKRKATLFISYNRENQYLAKSVYERLNKYDFHVFVDMMSMRSGDWYQAHTISSLDKAAENGYIIALINEQILCENSFSRIELIRALNHDKEYERKSILPFVRQGSIISEIGDDVELKPLLNYPIRCLSITSDEHLCDELVNHVLTTMLTPGTILTHAHNFKNGVNCKVDVEEAEKLYALYFSLARLESKHSPNACRALGQCYEFGWGTPVNLEEAESLYIDANDLLDGRAFNDDIDRVCQKRHSSSLAEQSVAPVTQKQSVLQKLCQFFNS